MIVSERNFIFWAELNDVDKVFFHEETIKRKNKEYFLTIVIVKRAPTWK